MSMRCTVRVRPRSAAPGLRSGPDGVLVVAVREVPEGGKANRAVVRALAEAFGVRRADVELIAGGSGRTKIVEIAGDERVLARRLTELTG